MEPATPAAPPERPRRVVGRGGAQVIPWPRDYRAGDRSPWAHLPPAARHVDVPDLRRAFERRRPRPPVHEPFRVRRPAAVLVPVYPAGDGLRVVLTRRPTAMRSHSGEVSFPGGGSEPGDPDLAATALREAEEEVGLRREAVEIIGRLDPLATLSSGAMITPFVGLVHERPQLRPEPSEVAAILHVPFAELLEDDVFHQEWWPMPAPPRTGAGEWRPMYFYELTGDTVWGATARLLTQLLSIATGTEGG